MAIGSSVPLRIPIFRSTERRTPDRPCTNCGDAIPGNFCRNCGQRKVEVHVSLRRMLLEALDDQFSINSALPRTLVGLFFRPGHLTREYMRGRIVRYIPPLRLYLVASVAFFLTLSFLPEMRDPLAGTEYSASPAAAARPPAPAAPTPGRTTAAQRITPPPVPAVKTASFLDGWSLQTGNAEVDSLLKVRMDHFRQMDSREAARQLMRAFLDNVPQMMFVLLPIFAVLLKVLYLGSRKYYVEHFVFALHVHAFAFLTYLVMIAVRWPPLVAALCAWTFVYVYAAMKRVYAQGWVVTGIRYGILAGTYLVLIFFAVLLTLVATVLTA